MKIAAFGGSYRIGLQPVGAAEGCDLLSAIKTYAPEHGFYVFRKYVLKTNTYSLKTTNSEKTVHRLSTDLKQRLVP
jgi:hypothetical protein